MAPTTHPRAGRPESAELRRRGEIGGKANGLVFFRAMLEAEFRARFAEIRLRSSVRGDATGVLTLREGQRFLRGRARAARYGDRRGLQKAVLPSEVAAELAGILELARGPLVRSSSLMKTRSSAPSRAFTRPRCSRNNQPEAADRLRKVVEAVKLVPRLDVLQGRAQLFHEQRPRDEKMARSSRRSWARKADRFYPLLSGVVAVELTPPAAQSPRMAS
jgi:hypothetical protein